MCIQLVLKLGEEMGLELGYVGVRLSVSERDKRTA